MSRGAASDATNESRGGSLAVAGKGEYATLLSYLATSTPDTNMDIQVLITLANVSFDLGLIDGAEYDERCRVALWLGDKDSSTADPREPYLDLLAAPEMGSDSQQQDADSVKLVTKKRLDDPGCLELVMLSKWFFTRSDPDPYPSTPHGHLESPNRPWPKLNPYTGRVFKAKHQEDMSLRLKRSELRRLWQAGEFRDFCRAYILWYLDAFPHHAFLVRHPLRLPRW